MLNSRLSMVPLPHQSARHETGDELTDLMRIRVIPASPFQSCQARPRDERAVTLSAARLSDFVALSGRLISSVGGAKIVVLSIGSWSSDDKVRDYDAELNALDDKARALKAKKVVQLGQLVTVTSPATPDSDVPAAALIATVEAPEVETTEPWCAKGHAFFQQRRKKARARFAARGTTMMRTGRAPRRAETGQCRTDTLE